MAEKLKARAVDPFPLEGMALGNIPVDQIMLDAATTNALINAKVAGGWRAGGSLAPEQILSSLLVVDNEGKVYNINDEFTTTDDFVEGAGITYAAGTNIAVIEATAASGETPATYKFDVLGGMDQSVIRQIVVTGLSTLIPTAGSVTLPLANADYTGVVKLTDALTATYGTSDGYAATPKAVHDALSSAKDYTDVLSTAVDTKISALDYAKVTAAPNQIISAISETDGIISAEVGDIAIPSTQVTDWDAATKATVWSTISANIAGANKPQTLSATIDLLMGVISSLQALSATA